MRLRGAPTRRSTLRSATHHSDIVIAPPNVAHKFTNDGLGRSTVVCIHANPTMVTEWLE